MDKMDYYELPLRHNGLTIEVNECVNREILKKIINNFSKLNTVLYDHRTNKYLSKADSKKRFTDLYNITEKNNNHKVIYKQSKKSGGRLRYYPFKGLGLGLMPNMVRGTLSKGVYYDIDMINCHPSILLNLCKKLNINTIHVKKLVENRDHYLTPIMRILKCDRSNAKQVIISWFFGSDKYEELRDNCDKLNKLFTEINYINNLLTEIYPEYVDMIDDDTFNLNGKVSSRILQDLENEILLTMYDYCLEQNINVDVLIYDGFMIRTEYFKDVNELNTFLKRLEEHIKDELDFDIKLTVKEFDEIFDLSGFDEEPEDEELDLLVENCFTNNRTSNDDIGKLFMYKNDLYKCVINKKSIEWYYFDKKWNVISEDKMKNHITDKVRPLFEKYENIISCKIKNLSKESEDYNMLFKRYAGFLKIIQKLINDCGTKSFINGVLELLRGRYEDDKFKPDENLNLIGFNNGVYDLNKREFREGRPEDYISCVCSEDYISDEDLHNMPDIDYYKEQLNKNLYVYTDKESMDHLLYSLSHSLGEKNRQVMTIITGSGGNGKSEFFNFIKNVLGDYYYNIPANYFTDKKNSSAESELYKCKNKRIVMFSEPDDTSYLKTDKIKIFTGEDNITTRELYKTTEIIKRTWNLYGCCNEIPKMKYDYAIDRRLKVIHFDKTFKCKEDIEKSKFKDDYIEIDNNFKDFMNLSIVKQIFMSMLLAIYKKNFNYSETENMIKQKESYKGDCEGSFGEFFNDCVERVNNINTSLNDAYEVYNSWFNNNDTGEKYLTKIQFSKNLKSMNVNLEAKTINKKTIKLYLNYRFHFEPENLFTEETDD